MRPLLQADTGAFRREFVDRYKVARLQGPVTGGKNGVAFRLDEPGDDVILSCIYGPPFRDAASNTLGHLKGFVWLVPAMGVAKQASIS